MRVYNGWKKASIIAALTGLFFIAAVMLAAGGYGNRPGFNDLSASSLHGFTQPPASNPVSLGVQDDGKTIYVNKGDNIRFTFVEYGAEDSWKMRSNPNVKVVSDLVMESYPMQRVLTVMMLAPADIYFDRATAPGGGKTRLVYHITFYGNSVLTPGTNNAGYVPDPTFDVPPVIISGYNSNNKYGTLQVKPIQGRFFDKVPLDIFNGKKLSGNLFRLK